MQSFEDWFDANEEELSILFAENGADREMDFDFEEECYKKYQEISYITDPINVKINSKA
jgi:hypothetical protein